LPAGAALPVGGVGLSSKPELMLYIYFDFNSLNRKEGPVIRRVSSLPNVRSSSFFLLVLAILVGAAGSAEAQSSFIRIALVTAGSSPTANGTALQVALVNITTNSATNPWLIMVEPGIYDLGSASLAMKDYVDIQGSGQDVTTITSTQSRGSSNLGVINVASGVHAELSNLTVKNTSSDAIGIANSSNTFSAFRTTVLIPGGAVSSFGILSSGSATYNLINIQISSSNNSSEAIYLGSGNPLVKDVTVNVQNTSAVVFSLGIGVVGGAATIEGANVTVGGAQINYGLETSTGAAATVLDSRFTATGGTDAYGIYLSGASAAFTNVTATAVTASGTSLADGFYNAGSTATVNNSTLTAKGTPTVGFGLQNAAAVTTAVNQSTLTGTADGIVVSNGSVNVGASQVAGGAIFALGTTLTCTGAYSAAYLPLNANCQ
jgi:hypothetical protein